jgi:hypothetical protein
MRHDLRPSFDRVLRERLKALYRRPQASNTPGKATDNRVTDNRGYQSPSSVSSEHSMEGGAVSMLPYQQAYAMDATSPALVEPVEYQSTWKHRKGKSRRLNEDQRYQNSKAP